MRIKYGKDRFGNTIILTRINQSSYKGIKLEAEEEWIVSIRYQYRKPPYPDMYNLLRTTSSVEAFVSYYKHLDHGYI